MKYYIILALSLMFAVIIADIGEAKHATTSVGDPANGIVNSRHNLASGWPFTMKNMYDGNFQVDVGTTEICVFCHTPHHGRSDTAPLWNKDLPDIATLTPYSPSPQGGSTLGGTTLNGPSGSSLACLSCHDGAGAFDSIINAPGKGTWNGTQFTSAIPNTAVNMPWTFKMPGAGTVGDHFDNTYVTCDCHRPPGTYGPLDPGGATGYAGFDNLVLKDGSKGLSNDHPISISYYGEGQANPRASLRATNTTISTINLNTEAQGSTMVKADGADGDNLWAVAGFISDTATISDLLRNGKIECSSCHDPHYKNQTNPEITVTYMQQNSGGARETNHEGTTVNGLFLRRVGGNSDSGVCRTCHAK